jgi:hypothetical protein
MYERLAVTFFALGGSLVALQGVAAFVIIFTRFNPEKLRAVLGFTGLGLALVGAGIKIYVLAHGGEG